jgi:hypothetical protein
LAFLTDIYLRWLSCRLLCGTAAAGREARHRRPEPSVPLAISAIRAVGMVFQGTILSLLPVTTMPLSRLFLLDQSIAERDRYRRHHACYGRLRRYAVLPPDMSITC